ncbi:MAG: ATP-binding protein, partial [Bacteroidota bacterium]
LIRTLLGSIASLRAAGEYDVAADRIAQGMTFADRLRSDKFRVSFLGERSKLAAAREDHATALDAYRQQVALERELRSAASIDRLNELETRYQSKLKDQEIAATSRELERERTARHRQLLTFLGLGLAVLAALALYANRLRLRRRLERQDKLILEHQVADLRQQKDIDTLHAMVQGQENERRRIARDLHDGISGLLAAAKIHFAPAAGRGPELLDQAAEDVRRIAHDLMPGALEKLGLVDATEEFIADQASATGPKVHFRVLGDPYRLGEARETSLFRVLQELVRNALKHAGATEISCTLRYRKDAVEATVRDDGRGFPENDHQSGMGLRSVAARVK